VKRFALKFLVLALLILLVSIALEVRITKANSQTVYGYTCVS